MKKVFVSSVIEGFSDERDAVKSAIESLDMLPIMAENFAAKPYSPQLACLEGINQSDIYVGILGPKYGSINTSSISATEEEFNEASKRGIPILWFVKTCKREPRQEAFYKKISSYSEGYFLNFFDSPTDLIAKVTKALFNLNKRANILDLSAAKKLTEESIKAIAPENDSDSALAAIIFPSDQSEPHISLLELGNQQTRDKLAQMALFGPSALFSVEIGTDKIDEREHFTLLQHDSRDRAHSIIQFYTNGTLVWRTNISDEIEPDRILAAYIIDKNEVQAKLTNFLTYADQYYAMLTNSPLLSSFYLTTILYNAKDKKFGDKPKENVRSISIGFGSDLEPLFGPQQPMLVSRAEIKNPSILADKITQLWVRAFKATGNYYGG